MDEKLRRQMQTLDRLYKESDRIGDDYACARSGFSRHRQ